MIQYMKIFNLHSAIGPRGLSVKSVEERNIPNQISGIAVHALYKPVFQNYLANAFFYFKIILFVKLFAVR